jgi:formylglycine-generating enzyme required for sulfatase activity
MKIPAGKKTLGRLASLALLLAITSLAQQESAKEMKPYGLEALLDGSGFVRIRAGEFLMGAKNGLNDEQPVHRVRIGRGFEMGKFEVTQAQWESLMALPQGAHVSSDKEKAAPVKAEKDTNPSHFKGSTLPVENVSWDDVQQFLQRLNARDSKHTYRLPTEAEWEYACRAGSTAEDAGNLDARAWYQANSGNKTHPVGHKQQNAWGLYDMQGNVMEWVQDWYGHNYYKNSPATNPKGPADGSYRVYRGGSWYGSTKDCRQTFRSFDLPVNHYYSLGFRLVRTPKQQ